jgi:hypothetical protein
VGRPPPPGGRCWSSGGVRIVCMRDIFILNEYEHKIKNTLVDTLLG